MIFRARTVAELFDLTIRLYRRRFTQYFIMAAVGLLPGILLSLAASALQGYMTVSILPGLSDPATLDRNALATYQTLNFVSSIAQNLASVLQSALSFGLVVPLVNVIFLADLQGESLTLRQALGRLRAPAWNLVALFAVLFGLYVVLFIWFIIPCIGWGTGLPMMVIFGWISPMAVTVSLVEGRQALPAIKRCWLLVRRRVWTSVGVIYLISIFDQLVMAGPLAIVAMFVLIPLQGMGYRDLTDLLPSLATGTVGGVLAAALTSVVVYPVSILYTSLWYLDLRTRFEGLDLSVRAYQRSGGSVATALRDAPPELNERFFRNEDMGQFFLMTVALFAIVAALWGVLYGGILALASMFGR